MHSKTFTETGAETGGQRRLPLAVAPHANARIRFAATDLGGPALLPAEALAVVGRTIRQGVVLSGVDLAGPGDPLASVDATLECLDLLSQYFPELTPGLVCLGLAGADNAERLAGAGLQRVTLQVDAISTVTAEKLYAWVRPGRKTVPLAQAVVTLLNEQALAASAFARAGVEVTVTTTVYPGYNDDEVEEIAMKLAALGATAMHLIPYRPVAGDPGLPAPTPELLLRLKKHAARHLPVIPITAGPPVEEVNRAVAPAAVALPRPRRSRPNVAVVSASGMSVDQHLGQASRVLIYGPREDDGLACLLATRPVPPAGGGSGRWETLAATLDDCFVLLAAGAGESPRTLLSRHDIAVMITDGDIEGSVDVLFGGGRKKRKRQQRPLTAAQRY